MTQRRRRRPVPGYRRPNRGRPGPNRPVAGQPAAARPVRRARTGGGLRGKAWLLALPIAALLIWLVLSNLVFVIRDVEVVGTQSMAAQDVVRLSGIRLGGRMDAVDMQGIRTSVESTGTLALVDVGRRYPSTLILTVRDRTRDAVILQAGKILVLDTDGYVVSAGDSMPEDAVPYVTGLKPSTYRIGQRLSATDAALDAMKAVLETLKEQGATGYVSELNVEDLKDITIITRKGTTVLLGNSDNMAAKIAWMARALQDLESRGESLGRLDVSSGKRGDFMPGVTVTPKPHQTQETFDVYTPTPDPGAATPPPDSVVIGEDAI